MVTEAPPVQIPTPTPTVGEQKRGPQANCSCSAGVKVKSQLRHALSLSVDPTAWWESSVETKKVSVFLFQGDTGAPGVAGPKGEKVIYPCS